MPSLRRRPRPPSMQQKPEKARAGPVLLVDPDPDSRDIGAILLRHFGYRVLAAAGADEGVRLARAERPCAVVCELRHDGAAEETIVAALAREPATAKVPVLVLSSYVLPRDRDRALADGAALFLEKPCDGAALRAALFRAVGEPRGRG